MSEEKKIRYTRYVKSRPVLPTPSDEEDKYLDFTENFRDYFDSYIGTENEYILREIPVDCYITIVQRLMRNERYLNEKIQKINDQFGKVINRRTFTIKGE